MQPVDGAGAGADEVVAVFGEAARAAIASSLTAVVSGVAVCAAIPTDRASAWSVLRPCRLTAPARGGRVSQALDHVDAVG